jgi:hypothetical protein
MTDLGVWQFSGAIPLSEDLSLLEAELHAGRRAAAERGFDGDPATIEIEEAMLVEDDHLMSESEALAAGRVFRPSHTRFVMTWGAAPTSQ